MTEKGTTMVKTWTRNARSVIVVLGITAALATAAAQGAVAATPGGNNTGGAGATTSAAPAPQDPAAPPGPAAAPAPPGPEACDTTAPAAPSTDKGHPRRHPHQDKGVIITGGGAGAQKPPTCDPATDPSHQGAGGTGGAGGTATPPAPNQGTGGTGGTATPPTPPTPPTSGSPAPPAGDPSAPPAAGAGPLTPGPVIHNGVVFPPSTEAPKPTAAAPTAPLAAIANATVIRSRSVSTVVTVPAGLPVTNPTEISILFGFSGSSRQTQTYNPAAGNRFVYNFDPGNGEARTEDVAVSLADRAVDGAHFGFVSKVPVEAMYDVSQSPLTFTLTNDCDFDLAHIFAQDSEPVIHWSDDRGQEATGELHMRAFNTITINKFARSFSGVTAKDGIKITSVWFDEIDDIPQIPTGFTAHVLDGGPVLPRETTHTESYNTHADTDESCGGNFRYTVTVNLLTYNAL